METRALKEKMEKHTKYTLSIKNKRGSRKLDRVGKTTNFNKMKKLVFILTAFTLFAFTAKAQTKKDGTPDMRYKSNKEAYGSPYTAPTYSSPTPTTSTSDYSTPTTTSSRPIYSGQTHTESHGGTYVGSTNSHHKDGTYVNPRSNNQYGIHKTKNN